MFHEIKKNLEFCHFKAFSGRNFLIHMTNFIIFQDVHDFFDLGRDYKEFLDCPDSFNPLPDDKF